MSNRWLNDLRRKMEDHTGDVPDGLWDDIREELFNDEDKKTVIGLVPEESVSKDKKISRPVFTTTLYRIGGIAAAIVLLFMVGRQWFSLSNKKVKPSKETAYNTKKEMVKKAENSVYNTVLQENTKGENIDIISSGSSYSKEIVSNKETELFGNIFTNSFSKENALLKAKSQQAKEQKNYNTFNLPEQDEKIVQNKKEDIAQSNENNESLKQEEKDLIPLYAENKMKTTKKASNKSWMLSLLTGKASPNSAQQFPGYATMDGNPLSVNDVWGTASYEENPLTEILLANQNKEVEATVRHKIPLNLGISLYYNLGKRWGIGTGVNYTKLSSELRSGSNSNFIKGEQTLHYIGVPVQINYNVIQKGRFTGYITGGALVEKAVAGSLKTKYIVNDEVTDEVKEKLEVKPVQVSLNGGLGAQLKLVDKIGVYVEPGIGYHFKDNSSLNTIYKDKPLNFNVKFGIRVSID
ncbi:outer membrane beta-barrel protein [Chryseobacterium tongliaoense]|uniref:outer membrane beta-barrel protein n=1 Tax=Chryseobacterium tongliaoense TaxID=3240933 RepID=UPI003518A177